MRRFNNCYRLNGGKLEPVRDPVQQDDNADFDKELSAAGYTSEVLSRLDGGADINIYATNDEEKPAYYIEVCGENRALAYLVADDFPGLLATLKELSPLIALVGLDQQRWIEAGREEWREKWERDAGRR